MNNLEKIADLKKQLELVYLKMPQTFFQQKMRDKAAFEISKQLEELENPQSYADNFLHWESHELRF
jgi:hypothetical protein